MTINYLRITLRCLLVLLWVPTLALASSVTFQQTLVDVNAFVIGIVFALSSLSGATALVLRIDKELRTAPGAKLPRPVLFAVSHMMGSWLAGGFAFIGAEAADLNDWSELGAIVLASFIGAKFVEKAAEAWLKGKAP